MRSKKISKFTRLISVITAVMLAVSCFGFDYDVFAAGKGAIGSHYYEESTTAGTTFQKAENLGNADEEYNIVTIDHNEYITLVEGSTTNFYTDVFNLNIKDYDTRGCTSSDPSIASVDNNGVITAISPGQSNNKCKSLLFIRSIIRRNRIQ